MKKPEEARVGRPDLKRIGRAVLIGVCALAGVAALVALFMFGAALLSHPGRRHNAPSEVTAQTEESAPPILYVQESPDGTPAPAATREDDTDEKRYERAVGLLEEGDLDAALALFQALGDYGDCPARCDEIRVRRIDILCEEGRISEAAGECYRFYQEKGDEQLRERCLALWDQILTHESISAGVNFTIGLKPDGTVVATGRNKAGQCEVRGWTDIIAISAGGWHSVGLKSDGTVVTCGSDFYGQRKVDDWTEIIAISGGSSHTVGLKADGTAVAAGRNDFGQCDLGEWTDLIAVSAGCTHTVGLKIDGTVIAAGDNSYGQCDVADWTDIIAISASELNTVGLKADGTVVACGDKRFDQCNVDDWTDIVAVSTYTNSVDNGLVYFAHTLGLKSDGTVVSCGSNRYGQRGVDGWTDVVAISAGGYHSVALRADGKALATVVTDERGDGGQCDVGSWPALLLPEG